eukprot:CAMPEP_0113642848 /NCGR_PEP_ID=MMETSP0017_2-20120614/22513_1 /TAXON_ID=2856 /ORGANISM="Cylindrotheca closterium" /LENGTH=269 /DNA_ID=CAMNT_0000554299 /DNA_START=25 /DNA_END=834 /DNA_ORIENTATION=- /assembly_acc=CAM_ASM_000147
MKLSTGIILASMASTCEAFVPPSSISQTSTLKMVGEEQQEDEPIDVSPYYDTANGSASSFYEPPMEQQQFYSPPPPVRPPLPSNSKAIPFLPRPEALDGSLVGDVGFDPLGFSKTKEDLWNNREAEIKHARLAMLAAAGWPISELWDAKIASKLALAPVVDGSFRAPSVLNGGLSKIPAAYWIFCFILAGTVEVIGASEKTKPGYIPGNLGFDPIGLYPKDLAGQKRMQLAELKNGRLAMIAIVGFAAQEFVTKTGVVVESAAFFQPAF